MNLGSKNGLFLARTLLIVLVAVHQTELNSAISVPHNNTLRVRRQAITDPQPWPGPVGPVSVPIPTNIAVFGGSNKPVDKCPRDEVTMDDGTCQQLLMQGSCKVDEYVLLNPQTNKGYCAPRLCPPDRIFVFSSQLCHDPRELNVCPPGRELFESSYGTPVCQCPDGTYEGDDDLDDDVCEPLLGQSPTCPPGQIFWIRDINVGPECLPDPCNGLNVNKGPNELPYIPSLINGRCFQIGSSEGVCPKDTFYGLDLQSLKGVCATLEEFGYNVFDTNTLSMLLQLVGPLISEKSGAPISTSAATAGLGVQGQTQISSGSQVGVAGSVQPQQTLSGIQHQQQISSGLQPQQQVTSGIQQHLSISGAQSQQVLSGVQAPQQQIASGGHLQQQIVSQGQIQTMPQPIEQINMIQQQIGLLQQQLNKLQQTLGQQSSATSSAVSIVQPGSATSTRGQSGIHTPIPISQPRTNDFLRVDDMFRAINIVPSSTSIIKARLESKFSDSIDPTVPVQNTQVNLPSFSAQTQQNQWQQKPNTSQRVSPFTVNRNLPQSPAQQPTHMTISAMSQNPPVFRTPQQPQQRQQFIPSQNTQYITQFSRDNQQQVHRSEAPVSVRRQQSGFINSPNSVLVQELDLLHNRQVNSYEVMNGFSPQQAGGNQYGSSDHFSPSAHHGVDNGFHPVNSLEIFAVSEGFGDIHTGFGGVKKRSIGIEDTSDLHSLHNTIVTSLNNGSPNRTSRVRRTPLPHAAPSNVFESRLLSCRGGAIRDINAKCRNAILPAKIPKVRPVRAAPPIKPLRSCGGAFNVLRMCVSTSDAASSINAFNLG